ncbi:hypothetical protein TPB0596_02240 [Tsukamurella pulmonis]|nr:hypothetical protein TPB0596_02240 [Tsukamurella pulmonis]
MASAKACIASKSVDQVGRVHAVGVASVFVRIRLRCTWVTLGWVVVRAGSARLVRVEAAAEFCTVREITIVPMTAKPTTSSTTEIVAITMRAIRPRDDRRAGRTEPPPVGYGTYR